jgi:hypothetical protein
MMACAEEMYAMLILSFKKMDSAKNAQLITLFKVDNA